MRRFKRVVAVDSDTLTATVEAGVVWKDLQAVLEEHDLELLMYPTSAPSSTVGGWLAQGGSGYGSYKNGWFRDVVVSARVVRPTGEIETVSGSNLDTVSEAEGTTGFITQVTVRVARKEDVNLLAAAFDTATALQAGLIGIAEASIPLWSVSFINPSAVRLGKQLPAKTHHGHPIHAVHTPFEVPESFVALLAWHGSAGDIRDRLQAVVAQAGGK